MKIYIYDPVALGTVLPYQMPVKPMFHSPVITEETKNLGTLNLTPSLNLPLAPRVQRK